VSCTAQGLVAGASSDSFNSFAYAAANPTMCTDATGLITILVKPTLSSSLLPGARLAERRINRMVKRKVQFDVYTLQLQIGDAIKTIATPVDWNTRIGFPLLVNVDTFYVEKRSLFGETPLEDTGATRTVFVNTYANEVDRSVPEAIKMYTRTIVHEVAHVAIDLYVERMPNPSQFRGNLSSLESWTDYRSLHQRLGETLPDAIEEISVGMDNEK